MKAKTGCIGAVAALWGWVPAALAATAGREDNSPLVVWMFLIFCALIVIAQVVPAIRGTRRAAIEERDRAAEERLVKVPAKD